MNWKLTDADFSSDPLISSSAVLLLSSVPMTTSWKAKGHFVQAKADKYKHARHDCSQFCDATPSGLWLCRVTQNSMKTLTTVSGGSSGTTRCKIGMLHDQQLASCWGYHGNNLKKEACACWLLRGRVPRVPSDWGFLRERGIQKPSQKSPCHESQQKSGCCYTAVSLKPAFVLTPTEKRRIIHLYLQGAPWDSSERLLFFKDRLEALTFWGSFD